jgi:small subunit ribosomal protein S1
MTQPKLSESPEAAAPDSSFGDILSEFEQGHKSRGETVEGTVVSITADAVFVDIGRKMDGIIVPDPAHPIKKGDKVLVSIRGRDEQGCYLLSTIKVETPRDWSGLEAAFADKRIIGGTVEEVVKGGLRVDVGIRAFMPASRSGVREQAEMEKLIGQLRAWKRARWCVAPFAASPISAPSWTWAASTACCTFPTCPTRAASSRAIS